ncbi:MAG: hypothetical protein V1701_07270 [Planctomycetota bacterium]
MNLSIIVTEYCNLACPSCMHGIPYLKDRKHFPVSYFEWLSGILSGIQIEALIIEGGEPTLHPDFIRLAPRMRQWFKPRSLILTTNGAQLRDVEGVLNNFDEIQLTEYRGQNDEEVAWARSRNIPGLYAGFGLPGGEQFSLDASPYENDPKPPMCRWNNCPIIWGETIWICAGAERLNKGISLKDADWESKLKTINRLEICRSCFVPPVWRIKDK